MKTAAELVVQVLADTGVKQVFGISGDSVLALIDAMDHTPGIRYMPVCHEQVGTAMADGYARVTGRPGVVLAHMGPGVCNVVIGLASAYRDSSPVIALTGVREKDKIGRDSWHEIDQLSLLQPITKWRARIATADSAARIMRLAVTQALSGRMGPVHVELPKDIARVESDVEAGEPLDCAALLEAARVAPNPGLVAQACDLLLAAERPVIFAGGGVLHSGASASLTAFAELLAIPVATTNKGRSSIPEDHPLCLGPSGRYGTPFADKQIKQADVLLGLGCRFSDLSTRDWTLIAPETKIIHVDIDPKELGRQYDEELSILGDAELFLQTALKELKKRASVKPIQGSLETHPRVRALVREREAEREAFFAPSAHASIPGQPHLLVKEISDTLARDAIISLGSGLYSRFSGRIRVAAPRSYLKSVGLGAMGWAFPAAMGAKLAEPSRQVVALLGDGDFMMVMQDLETAVRENIAVAVVVFNDYGHASIREIQRREYGGRIVGSDYKPPPFHEIARVMGAVGVRANKLEEVKPALSTLLKSGKPGLLEIAIAPQPL
jgi:acetolactate synthase-1/2/3 large subunit